MIASLPMYDRPETRAANQRLWHRIRDDLRSKWRDMPETACPLPNDLAHPSTPRDHWTSPDLILSQTCGLPFRTELHHTVHLVGTPDYGLPGCPPGHYNSVIVMRRGDDRADPIDWDTLTLAVNSTDSQSGWAAPLNFAASLGARFGSMTMTGAHRASAQAVAEGRADIAAIDAQTWRMICRWDGIADQLKEVGRTEPTPGLPLISALRDERSDLSAAVGHQFDALPDEDRNLLDVRGLVFIGPEDYLAVPTPDPLHSLEIRA